MYSTSAKIPKPAAYLGALGALLFAVLSGAALFSVAETAAWLEHVLLIYGAVVLSFLGGIHWGLAIATDDVSWPRLMVGVVPSLVGWLSVFLPTPWSFWVIGFGFGGMLIADHTATGREYTPLWFPRLRYPLTFAVFVCLLALIFF